METATAPHLAATTAMVAIVLGNQWLPLEVDSTVAYGGEKSRHVRS